MKNLQVIHRPDKEGEQMKVSIKESIIKKMIIDGESYNITFTIFGIRITNTRVIEGEKSRLKLKQSYLYSVTEIKNIFDRGYEESKKDFIKNEKVSK